jgi:LuxR family maltose regulon positive regulatory protein
MLALVAARIARGRLALAGSELCAAEEQLRALGDAGRLTAMAADIRLELAASLAGQASVVESPSPAELSVLRLLATDMSQREIGDQLYLSLNTVKSHSRNVYVKLGVHDRAGAVERAYQLGLIDSPEPEG